ncbi:MAG: AAA family ATPase [Bacteroidia bacterium]|nr:AAA family ATPase [Bacteroidia bacterium]
MYSKRIIDKYLQDWVNDDNHKPILLRGARQVGKSSAVRNLGNSFEVYLEINFERNPEYKAIFEPNLDIPRIVSQLSAMSGKRVVPGKTLVFLDEIQECKEAIMSLRFFKEDMPQLHVVAAGSLLEFALQELPTFGVGRIHSMFMYPMTFDEFLVANSQDMLIEAKNSASPTCPLPEPIHEKLIELYRVYMMVGGMPEVVSTWVATHDYIRCQKVQDDIIVTYEDDFSKYKKRVDPILLRQTLRSAAIQVTNKFAYSQVSTSYKSEKIKEAVSLLILAGILIPVTHTNANGLPLGSEANDRYRKMLLLDNGLLLRLLNMSMGDISSITEQILTASATDLVNKGPMTELIAGLEILRSKPLNMRHELYYWTRQEKNSLAEVDYVDVRNSKILPIEIKAGTQGGMKSLWIMIREKKIQTAIRHSLENFGLIRNEDGETEEIREVIVWPVYAISNVWKAIV